MRAVTEQLESDDNRFSTMVLGIVRSYPFQYRRNSDASFE